MERMARMTKSCYNSDGLSAQKYTTSASYGEIAALGVDIFFEDYHQFKT